MERIEAERDDLAMIIDADGTTIFVFPTSLMKLSKGAMNSEKAAEMFEEFHHFPADDYDYELFPPSGEKLLSAGHADRILYVSDKVIYAEMKKARITITSTTSIPESDRCTNTVMCTSSLTST
jgi:hypothetical protein